MNLGAWLLQFMGEHVANGVSRRAGSCVFGSAMESALHKALVNAAFVAAETAADEDQRASTAEALSELITRAAPSRLAAGTALDDLKQAVRASLQSLWTTTSEVGTSHAAELGIALGIDELTALIVDEIIASIGLETDATSDLATLVALLQTQQNQRHVSELLTASPIARSTYGGQATRVNAWVAVADNIPVVNVMNNSDAPIYDVRPSPTLIGYAVNGEVAATVGHSPLQLVRQIDPQSGFAWPMQHCPGWGGHDYVAGHVHLHFVDAAGVSWLLAHDRLLPEEDTWTAG